MKSAFYFAVGAACGAAAAHALGHGDYIHAAGGLTLAVILLLGEGVKNYWARW